MQARDIYEEAIQTVITVRDFTQVFDAYAQFEKSSIASKMEAMEEKGSTDEGEHLLQVTDLQMKAIKELLLKEGECTSQLMDLKVKAMEKLLVERVGSHNISDY